MRGKKVDDMICQAICASFKLSAETKMEDTNPIFRENHEIQKPDNTI